MGVFLHILADKQQKSFKSRQALILVYGLFGSTSAHSNNLYLKNEGELSCVYTIDRIYYNITLNSKVQHLVGSFGPFEDAPTSEAAESDARNDKSHILHSVMFLFAYCQSAAYFT